MALHESAFKWMESKQTVVSTVQLWKCNCVFRSFFLFLSLSFPLGSVEEMLKLRAV